MRSGGWGGSYGGQIGMPRATPWVRNLLIANAAVFLLTVAVGFERAFELLAFSPARALTRPWAMITYMFVHAGLWHLLMNLLIIYFFGPPLEERWGSDRFIKFYLICGLGGALLSFAFSDSSIVGASAACLRAPAGLRHRLAEPDDLHLGARPGAGEVAGRLPGGAQPHERHGLRQRRDSAPGPPRRGCGRLPPGGERVAAEARRAGRQTSARGDRGPVGRGRDLVGGGEDRWGWMASGDACAAGSPKCAARAHEAVGAVPARRARCASATAPRGRVPAVGTPVGWNARSSTGWTRCSTRSPAKGSSR